MRVLKTAPGKVLDVAFSPDSRAVAAAVEESGLFLWNLDSPTLAPVRLDAGGEYRPGGLRFSADGRQLEWQLPHARCTYDRDDPGSTNEYPAFLLNALGWKRSADGDLIVSTHGLPEHLMAGWRLKDGDWVRQWQLSTQNLSVAAEVLSPDGMLLALFTRVTDHGRWWENPMRLEVRDAGTSEVRARGTYPYSYAARLAFAPNADQLAGINDAAVLVWSLPAGGDPRLVRNDSRKHFTALAYHPTGHRLFVTSNDETVHVFDTHSLERATRYTWQLDKLSAVAVSPDGTLAAAGSANGDVVVWDLD
ncbi:MAG: WD40 repeat domain-containing protein [Gemmataceae bacterium]|nr:WD40 repeat domain-containing protein [Gemmataceae bacterium]